MAKKKHFKSMKRQNFFAGNMLTLSNKSQARNTADYCVKAMPYLYSAMAIALYREFGFGHKRLERLFAIVDDIWNEYADSGATEELAEICLQETGIALVHKEDAIQKGILNGD